MNVSMLSSRPVIVSPCFGHDAIGAVLRQDLGVRSRRDCSISTVRRSAPMSLRSGPVREPVVHAMTGAHVPLLSKMALPRAGLPLPGRARPAVARGSQISHDGPGLEILQVVRRHGRARDAVLNDLDQSFFRIRLAETCRGPDRCPEPDRHRGRGRARNWRGTAPPFGDIGRRVGVLRHGRHSRARQKKK